MWDTGTENILPNIIHEIVSVEDHLFMKTNILKDFFREVNLLWFFHWSFIFAICSLNIWTLFLIINQVIKSFLFFEMEFGFQPTQVRITEDSGLGDFRVGIQKTLPNFTKLTGTFLSSGYRVLENPLSNKCMANLQVIFQSCVKPDSRFRIILFLRLEFDAMFFKKNSLRIWHFDFKFSPWFWDWNFGCFEKI